MARGGLEQRARTVQVSSTSDGDENESWKLKDGRDHACSARRMIPPQSNLITSCAVHGWFALRYLAPQIILRSLFSMPPTNAKKRKAEEILDVPEVRGTQPWIIQCQRGQRETPSRPGQPDTDKGEQTQGGPQQQEAQPSVVPQLPAPVWGHVLDYMPYQDVRSALLVGKLIANEAVKYVHTLNIMRSCEMNVRAARRFSNVHDLHVLCLLEPTGEDDDVILSTDTAMCLLPLVSAFPKLKTLFAGCRMYSEFFEEDTFMTYFRDECVGPDNHIELMRGLVSGFCGAFKTGLLPDSLEMLEGITSSIDDCRSCNDPSGTSAACTICRDTVLCLPIVDVIHRGGAHHVCSSKLDFYRALFGRPGGLSRAQKDVDTMFHLYFSNLFSLERVSTADKLRLHKTFRNYRGEDMIACIPDRNYTDAKEAWAYLREHLAISEKAAKDYMHQQCYLRPWAKSSLEKLIKIGLPVTPEYFERALDDRKPAMEFIRHAIANGS